VASRRGPGAARVAVVLGVYVLPLTAAVVYLLSVGLPVLAIALVVVEAFVVGLVVVARRWPAE
jgi:hypothetical protein